MFGRLVTSYTCHQNCTNCWCSWLSLTKKNDVMLVQLSVSIIKCLLLPFWQRFSYLVKFGDQVSTFIPLRSIEKTSLTNVRLATVVKKHCYNLCHGTFRTQILYVNVCSILHQLSAPDYDRSCWFSVKETLGLPFPNVRRLLNKLSCILSA